MLEVKMGVATGTELGFGWQACSSYYD